MKETVLLLLTCLARVQVFHATFGDDSGEGYGIKMVFYFEDGRNYSADRDCLVEREKLMVQEKGGETGPAAGDGI